MDEWHASLVGPALVDPSSFGDPIGTKLGLTCQPGYFGVMDAPFYAECVYDGPFRGKWIANTECIGSGIFYS